MCISSKSPPNDFKNIAPKATNSKTSIKLQLTSTQLIEEQLTKNPPIEGKITEVQTTNERLTKKKPTNERLTNEHLNNERLTNEHLNNERLANEHLNKEQLIEEQPIEEHLNKEQLIEEQLIEEQPIEEQLIEGQLIEEKLIEEQLTKEQPIKEQLIEEQPIGEQLIKEQLIKEKLIKEPTEEQQNEEQQNKEQQNEERQNEEQQNEEQQNEERPTKEQLSGEPTKSMSIRIPLRAELGGISFLAKRSSVTKGRTPIQKQKYSSVIATLAHKLAIDIRDNAKNIIDKIKESNLQPTTQKYYLYAVIDSFKKQGRNDEVNIIKTYTKNLNGKIKKTRTESVIDFQIILDIFDHYIVKGLNKLDKTMSVILCLIILLPPFRISDLLATSLYKIPSLEGLCALKDKLVSGETECNKSKSWPLAVESSGEISSFLTSSRIVGKINPPLSLDLHLDSNARKEKSHREFSVPGFSDQNPGVVLNSVTRSEKQKAPWTLNRSKLDLELKLGSGLNLMFGTALNSTFGPQLNPTLVPGLRPTPSSSLVPDFLQRPGRNIFFPQKAAQVLSRSGPELKFESIGSKVTSMSPQAKLERLSIERATSTEKGQEKDDFPKTSFGSAIKIIKVPGAYYICWKSTKVTVLKRGTNKSEKIYNTLKCYLRNKKTKNTEDNCYLFQNQTRATIERAICKFFLSIAGKPLTFSRIRDAKIKNIIDYNKISSIFEPNKVKNTDLKKNRSVVDQKKVKNVDPDKINIANVDEISDTIDTMNVVNTTDTIDTIRNADTINASSIIVVLDNNSTGVGDISNATSITDTTYDALRGITKLYERKGILDKVANCEGVNNVNSEIIRTGGNVFGLSFKKETPSGVSFLTESRSSSARDGQDDLDSIANFNEAKILKNAEASCSIRNPIATNFSQGPKIPKGGFSSRAESNNISFLTESEHPSINLTEGPKDQKPYECQKVLRTIVPSKTLYYRSQPVGAKKQQGLFNPSKILRGDSPWNQPQIELSEKHPPKDIFPSAAKSKLREASLSAICLNAFECIPFLGEIPHSVSVAPSFHKDEVHSLQKNTCTSFESNTFDTKNNNWFEGTDLLCLPPLDQTLLKVRRTLCNEVNTPGIICGATKRPDLHPGRILCREQRGSPSKKLSEFCSSQTSRAELEGSPLLTERPKGQTRRTPHGDFPFWHPPRADLEHLSAKKVPEFCSDTRKKNPHGEFSASGIRKTFGFSGTFLTERPSQTELKHLSSKKKTSKGVTFLTEKSSRTNLEHFSVKKEIPEGVTFLTEKPSHTDLERLSVKKVPEYSPGAFLTERSSQTELERFSVNLQQILKNNLGGSLLRETPEPLLSFSTTEKKTKSNVHSSRNVGLASAQSEDINNLTDFSNIFSHKVNYRLEYARLQYHQASLVDAEYIFQRN